MSIKLEEKNEKPFCRKHSLSFRSTDSHSEKSFGKFSKNEPSVDQWKFHCKVSKTSNDNMLRQANGASLFGGRAMFSMPCSLVGYYLLET